MKTICLDAGHGGIDSGASGSGGVCEKDCTLALAMHTGAALLERGFYVIFTRREDRALPFEERAAIANMGGANAFLSLHCGSSPMKNLAGARIFALREPGGGARWAALIGRHIKKNLCPPLTLRGVQLGSFASLTRLNMPAVAVETACITHSGERKLLLDETFHASAAKAFAQATYEYFE